MQARKLVKGKPQAQALEKEEEEADNEVEEEKTKHAKPKESSLSKMIQMRQQPRLCRMSLLQRKGWKKRRSRRTSHNIGQKQRLLSNMVAYCHKKQRAMQLAHLGCLHLHGHGLNFFQIWQATGGGRALAKHNRSLPAYGAILSGLNLNLDPQGGRLDAAK